MDGEPLASKRCVPCEGKIASMSEGDARAYLKQVDGWSLVTSGTLRITRTFMFDDFSQSMAFVNEVAGIAEDEGHHPDIYIYYNKVVLDLHTHAVRGLVENDFILAAKINTIKKV